MELLFIRHGRPEVQHADTAAGADPVLTEEGAEQARALGRHLAAGALGRIDAVHSSPMRRARETADAIGAALGLPVVADERLLEFDAGARSYVPPEEHRLGRAERAEQWRALETGVWGRHTFDPDAFERRVRAAVDDIVAAHASATVAVVCHSGVINSYVAQVIGRPRGMFVQPDYTSISRVVAARSGHRQLRSINETPHLQLGSFPNGARP